MKEFDIIIAGVGAAGMSATDEILKYRTNQSVLLISEEKYYPYKRTKLSKSLNSKLGAESFVLKETNWYKKNGLELTYGSRLKEIDKISKTVSVADKRYKYKVLILAQGAAPKKPEFLNDASVFYFANQYDELKKGLSQIQRIAVVGNGVLGVELAEQCALAGKDVSLIGHPPYPLHREFNETLGLRLQSILEKNNINVIYKKEITRDDISGYDYVIACTGVVPSIEPAKSAGLDVGKGVKVNSFLQTNDPSIFAAGDCAENLGHVSHLWHEAQATGEIAGFNALQYLKGGELKEYKRIPWRMKCEVFGDYYFSICYKQEIINGAEAEAYNEDEIYRCVYKKNGRVVAMLMAGEKDRAKEYQKLVQEAYR